MPKDERYFVLHICSDDVVINVEDNLTPEEALDKYLELKDIADDVDFPESFIFLIEGKILRKNKKNGD